jgi:predicted metalloprotease with PDZ domain
VKFCSLLLLLWSVTLAAQSSVEYRLRFPNAVHHEAEVRAKFVKVPQATLEVLMSRSSPGRYALHEFAKNVYNVRATDEDGRPLKVTRSSPYSWTVAVPHGTVVFEYTLFGDYADGTYAAIDSTHAHLNLPATLVWARGFEHSPASLSFEVPPRSNWQVATQLMPHAGGQWTAPNLEWLMDSPVELSAHDLPEWKVEDTTFRLALHHRGSAAEAQAYATMCQAVVSEAEGVFGSFPKYENSTYTFLIDYLPYVARDGMEHRDSTVITGTGDLKDSAAASIGAVSHEFFHSWNVKRIRPRSLEPFDFERADMSSELWFAEGFTNYYGPLILERSGLESFEQFIHSMSRAVNAVLTAPGRSYFSAAGMSRLAPFRDAATSIDPTNFENIFISYYTYGQALALGIDLAIREHFPGKSLDDWMRTMWREHPDIDKPYTLVDLEKTLAETTSDKSFAREIFEHHITGKAPLPFAELLAPAGLKLQGADPEIAWLGRERLEETASGMQITGNALKGSPLYNAGLERGDVIAACENKPVRKGSALTDCVKHKKPGDKIVLLANTRSGESKVSVTLGTDPSVEVVSFEKAGLPVTPEIKAFRSAWLSSRSLHKLPKVAANP